MSDLLSKGAQAAVIMRGLPVIKKGLQLSKKNNKTEEEAAAARSFQRFYRWTWIIVITLTVLLIPIMIYALTSFESSSYTRLGTVMEDGTVRYNQNNEMQYKTLEELGLEGYNLEKGNLVVLIFESYEGALTGAVPKSDYEDNSASVSNERLIIMFVYIVFMLITFVLWAIAGRNTVGLDFYVFEAISARRGLVIYEGTDDEKEGLYESIFKRVKGDIKLTFNQIFYGFLVLILFFCFGVSGALFLREFYGFFVDEMLVLTCRVVGAVSFAVCSATLFYMLWLEKNRMNPVFFNNDDLLNTQLLTRNDYGNIGYFNRSGVWTELKAVQVIRAGKYVLKLNCSYLNTNTGTEFSQINYIAREDEIFRDVIKLAGPFREKGSLVYPHFIMLLVIYALVIVSNLVLLSM